jgi:hypothetical protein
VEDRLRHVEPERPAREAVTLAPNGWLLPSSPARRRCVVVQNGSRVTLEEVVEE